MAIDLHIERKPLGFCCIFEHKGQEYLASLILQTAYADFYGSECVIFKSKNRQIASFEDALGVCMMRNIDLSPAGLVDCVTDFIQWH